MILQLVKKKNDIEEINSDKGGDKDSDSESDKD